ncbi:hypothetical protein [Achromobacter xylosoxidans]|uniref:hypothetical protein n=1 Tax=Alcaligenes xylosoxydans xylosoxydans TaxID=85698 RepID=UPI000AE37C99|nr:hypothetical protein [Achromobacter xylosoxidans]
MKFTSISELTTNGIEIFGTKFLGRKDYRLSFFLSSKKGIQEIFIKTDEDIFEVINRELAVA